MFDAATEQLVDTLVGNEPGPAIEDALFALFAEYVVHNYSSELQSYRCAQHLVADSGFTILRKEQLNSLPKWSA